MFSESYVHNAKVYEIMDHRLRGFVQQTCMQLCDPEIKRFMNFKFPGPLPITIERKHVSSIKHSDFLFTPKADGVRALVIMFRYHIDNDWVKMTVLLYRDGTCQLVPGLHTTDEPCDHGGSVFDCELVNTESGVKALLFDCYSFSGVSYLKNSTTRRIAKCEHLVSSSYAAQPGDPITFEVKIFHKLSRENIHTFNSYMNGKHVLDYTVDGVVLVPNNRKHGSKLSHDTQFKMKSSHTIDLIILEDGGDIYIAAYDDQDDSYVTKQQLDCIPLGGKANDIVECRMKLEQDLVLFEPFLLRPDKTHPNSDRVIELTINTVKDNIGINDIIS